NLYKGREITEQELNEVVRNEIYVRFLDRTVSYIARAMKSEKDVRKYLKEVRRKKQGDWFSDTVEIDWETMFEEIITTLKKNTYLDDLRYAKQFIESRTRSKPRSKRMISMELMGKGIDRETVSQAINDSEIDEVGLLKEVFEK